MCVVGGVWKIKLNKVILKINKICLNSVSRIAFIITIKKNGKKIHSTQKPEALLHRIILATTNKGDSVFDPFLGTGTTAVVSKKLGRNYCGI